MNSDILDTSHPIGVKIILHMASPWTWDESRDQEDPAFLKKVPCVSLLFCTTEILLLCDAQCCQYFFF